MVQNKIILMLFHISVAALDLFALLYDQFYVDLPFPTKDLEALPFKARYIFLTVWCLVLQIVYFSVSFLNDVYGSDSALPKNPHIIRRVKDVLFSLTFTVAVYVSITFWAMYCINKDLIFPIEIESKFPVWMNHVMHTTIVPFIFIELFVTKRNYPSRKFGFNLTMSVIFVYTLLVFRIYFMTNVWVYPFMDFLNWTMRFVFCVVSTGAAFGIYILGEKLDRLACSKARSYSIGVNGHAKKH